MNSLYQLCKDGLPIKILIVAIIFILAGCSSSDETDNSNQQPTVATTTEVVNNIENISKNLIPASLDFTAASANAAGSNIVIANAAEDDACEDYDLFSCQPVLLRVYLEMTNAFLDETLAIIAEAGENIGIIPIGDSGSADLENGLSVEYSHPSENEFSLLILNNDIPAIYLDVDNNNYTLIADTSTLPADQENDTTLGKIELQIDYTDVTIWDVSTTLTDFPCKPLNPWAPQTVQMTIGMNSNIWQGNAMLYSPIWAQSITDLSCDETHDPGLSACIYTEFIADNDAAKANVYMMPETATSIDEENSGLDSLCTQYPTIFGLNCQNLASFLQIDLSQYQNSFCNPASTDAAEWNNDCSAYSDFIAGAEFPTSSWIAPNQIPNLHVTLPETIL